MNRAQLLADELDHTVTALMAFDSETLDAVEDRICAITAEHLAHSRHMLPELLSQHTRLGQLLEVTAANLKVLVAVLNLQTRMAPHRAAGTETR